MKNFNEDAFLLDMRSFYWQFLLKSSSGLGEIVHYFTNVLYDIIQKHAPMVEKLVSYKYSPWMSFDLKRLFKARDKIKIAAVKNNSEFLMSAYR